MTDILDGTIAEIKAAQLSVVEARHLLAAEKAGKTRKGVIAHLEDVIASAPVAADETAGAYIVTAKGAGRIHKGRGIYLAEGEVVEGAPESLADLERRGFVRLG